MNIVDLLTLDNASKFCEFKDTEYGDFYDVHYYTELYSRGHQVNNKKAL